MIANLTCEQATHSASPLPQFAVQDNPVTALRLGLVERRVGLSQEDLRRRGVIGINRKAHAERQRTGQRIEGELLLRLMLDPLADHARLRGSVQSGQQQNQLVAPPACHRVGLAHARADAAGNLGQNPVADVPSVTLLPGCDGDVADLQGEDFVDGTRGVSRGTALHSAVYVVGANHNYFNSEWTPGEAEAPAEDDVCI